MSVGESSDQTELLCHRCGALLTLGEGSCYVVRIEAFADPTAPRLEPDQSPDELADQWEQLLASMRDMSEQELLDQVYRRLTLRLCTACYQRWIENPVGGSAP